jgi:transcriptional regulator with XRE-family HTH domain
MADITEDTSMDIVRAKFKASGLSLHALGVAMGYDAKTARQSAFQFMKSGDPRISMLRRFAKAMEMPLEELLAEGKGKPAKLK